MKKHRPQNAIKYGNKQGYVKEKGAREEGFARVGVMFAG
jgi:hypothetical protein